jgi:hypothetical protein
VQNDIHWNQRPELMPFSMVARVDGDGKVVNGTRKDCRCALLFCSQPEEAKLEIR